MTATRTPRPRDDAERLEPRRSARLARLRYSTDDRPGISRRRAGRGFTYRDAKGRTIRHRATLERIKALAVPPAWTNVWICADADGHIQATGRDARGRKQYRYHPRWRSRRDESKFERIVAIARLLPRIRRRCDQDLARRALSRDKVLAAVVRLLELTLIRVGNDEYARLNRSFGLTTLEDRHVTVRGTSVRFRFKGKSGRQHEVTLQDRRLANLIRRCQELPGQDLFQYLDEEGVAQNVTSDDVNEYLRAAAGADVTTRDFRIWSGTVLAYRTLCELDPPNTPQEAKRNVIAAVQASADGLGNTVAVARHSYVHPAVLEGYLADDGSVPVPRSGARSTAEKAATIDLATERRLLRILEQLLERDVRRISAR